MLVLALAGSRMKTYISEVRDAFRRGRDLDRQMRSGVMSKRNGLSADIFALRTMLREMESRLNFHFWFGACAFVVLDQLIG